MEGPKRYFPTTGKTGKYENIEILHLDALSAGFDENNKPIPYIVIATFYDEDFYSVFREEKFPVLIYSSTDFKNLLTLRFYRDTYKISSSDIYYEVSQKKIIKTRGPKNSTSNTNILDINFYDLRRSDKFEISAKNIEFRKLEIIHVLIKTPLDGLEPQNIYSKLIKGIYFVGWYYLDKDGKAVLYDEVEATQIMENCINCNSSYKFIERSKEHNTFCSKDCQVEHYQFSPK